MRTARNRAVLIALSAIIGSAAAVVHPVVVASTIDDATEAGANARGQHVAPFRERRSVERLGSCEYALSTTLSIRPAFLAPGVSRYQWTRDAIGVATGDPTSHPAWAPGIALIAAHEASFQSMERVSLAYGWPFVSMVADHGATSFRKFDAFEGFRLEFLSPIATDAGEIARSLPSRVVWAGLLLNAILWSCVSWVTLTLIDRLRHSKADRMSAEPA